jgi:hypothetical protein
MSHRAHIFLVVGLIFIATHAQAQEPLFHSISVKPETPVEGSPFAITYVSSRTGVITTDVSVSNHVIKLEPQPTHMPWPPLPWTVSVPGLPAGNYTIQISAESEFFGTMVFATKPLVIAPAPVPAFGTLATILLAAALAILGVLAARSG